MSMRGWLMAGVFGGSTLGGIVPSIFGAGMTSTWGVIGTALGGFAGLYVGWRIAQECGAE